MLASNTSEPPYSQKEPDHWTHLSGSLRCLLQPPAVGCPALGGAALVGDEEVVKEDVGGHGPELEPHGAERSHPERVQVLKVGWVGDLPWLPDALETQRGQKRPSTAATPKRGGSGTHLVVGVVDHWGLPFALVAGVFDHWSFPGSTARRRLAGGIRDLRSLPFSVHVFVPEEHKLFIRRPCMMGATVGPSQV